MAYIYKIVNNINNKVYIGKTQYSPILRWQQHKSCLDKDGYKDRPLYKALKKYGVDNFSFSIIEETQEPETQEIKYILEYKSYVGFPDCNGYNATLGGDGKKYAFSNQEEVELLVLLFNKEKTINEISDILERDEKTISLKLKELGFIIDRNKLKKKQVVKCNKITREELFLFDSITAAAESVGGSKQHISEVCNGDRKSAYGFYWKFL
jgi:group I intron endonuclease